MEKESLGQHGISDRLWTILAPHLPGQRGMWGGIARDNRQFINAVLWILRTGAPWRDLPAMLWRLEKYAQTLLSLERQRSFGKFI